MTYRIPVRGMYDQNYDSATITDMLVDDFWADWLETHKDDTRFSPDGIHMFWKDMETKFGFVFDWTSDHAIVFEDDHKYMAFILRYGV